MRKTILSLSLIFAASVGFTHAQDIFKKHGLKKKPLTFCDGQYNEFINNPEVVQIGTVMYNTRTNKVIKLIDENTLKTTYKAEFSSMSLDPKAEKYYSVSPYAFCNNNPVNLIDPDGMEWFYHSADGKADPTWIWHDGSTYNTGVKDSNGKEVVLQGTEAVVVFNGSRQEKLGTKDGKSGFIDGEGAVTANVTVYGPDGANDIHNYTGYTMSSNATSFGAIDEGIYNGNYDAKGKSGSLKSNWTLEHRGKVRMMDGNINPNAPSQIDSNGEGYKDGIFIHSSNNSGFAAGRVSTGCLLIAPNNWSSFNQAMSGVQNFKVQVIRTQTERVSLQGVTGPVQNAFILQRTVKY